MRRTALLRGTARLSVPRVRLRTMTGTIFLVTTTRRGTRTCTLGRRGTRRTSTRPGTTTGTRAGLTTTRGTSRRVTLGTRQLRTHEMTGICRRSGCTIRTAPRHTRPGTPASSALAGRRRTTHIALRIRVLHRLTITPGPRPRTLTLGIRGQGRSPFHTIRLSRFITHRRMGLLWPTCHPTITMASPCRRRSRCTRIRRRSLATRLSRRRLRRPRRRRATVSSLAATASALRMMRTSE
mmetsp:Transcript_30507/g.68901  ORF Transcript_30507/g.68901 Transcript_30507/m.68901 type:complete len:238 (+) Transcript_30507:194-907(+)